MPITQDEVSKEIKLNIPDDVPEKLAEDIKKEVGDFIIESILSSVADSVSPVDGGKFEKKLSKAYAEETGKTFANLDLNGDMLNSLVSRVTDKGVEVGIFDSSQTPKAFNHNTGDTLPQRQFIPSARQKFDADIMAGVNEIVQSRVSDFKDNQNETVRTEARTTPVNEDETVASRVTASRSALDTLLGSLFGRSNG